MRIPPVVTVLLAVAWLIGARPGECLAPEPAPAAMPANLSTAPAGDPPGKATHPNPGDGASYIPHGAPLSWSAGSRATSHRVSLGTTPPGVYRGTVTTPAFNVPEPLPGPVCYWRIDEVNAAGTTVGDVWRFTTRGQSAPADFDADGDVDRDDLAHFQSCLSGPDVEPIGLGCLDALLDDDRDVDQDDFTCFQQCMSGPNVPAPARCVRSASSGDLIPPRPPDAMPGSEFITTIMNLNLHDREARILDEVVRGNIPAFLRVFVPIHVSAAVDETVRQAAYQVMPDYLSVGSDADFIRMPMTPHLAQQVADRFECVLPTRTMVDDIYRQAAVKLAPSPIDPRTMDIARVSTFYHHHLTLDAQQAGSPFGLIAGIKKDVVVTPQLLGHADKVAIYGWHQLNGTPIQNLYVGHAAGYVDYSHGIRLVRGTMTVDGKPMSVADVLRHPRLHVLLSDEGIVEYPRY